MEEIKSTKKLHNFHVPLPSKLYKDLRAEAKQSTISATALARHAIKSWLYHRHKAAMRNAIALYAAQHAATPADLDEAMEKASVELLLEQDGDA